MLGAGMIGLVHGQCLWVVIDCNIRVTAQGEGKPFRSSAAPCEEVNDKAIGRLGMVID